MRKPTKGNRFMALLLSLCMVMTMLPMMSLTTANAAGIEVGQLDLKVNQSKVAFAGHEWWVIGDETSGVYPKSGHITLLAANLDSDFQNVPFRSGQSDEFTGSSQYSGDGRYYANNPASMKAWTTPNEYAGSTMQQKMESIANGFSPKEQAVISARSLTGGGTYQKPSTDRIAGPGVDKQKLWALSEAEWRTINNTEVRKYDDWWWLRSPSPVAGYDSWESNDLGSSIIPGHVYGVGDAARPAFSLNLSSVLFISAADRDVKAHANMGIELIKAEAPKGTVKFTMIDESQKLTVKATDEQKTQTGDTLKFSYSNATTGEYQFISCILTDEAGAVKYYAPLTGNHASGTLSIPLKGVEDGAYTLKIFSEQVNEDFYTDFCSEPMTMKVEVSDGIGTVSEFNTVKIATAKELKAFRDRVNAGETELNAILTNDIDLNPGFTFDEKGGYAAGQGSAAEPEQWTPIGSNNHNFNGTFDGQGHTVSGLYINTTASDDYRGLFGQVDEKGIVKGINLENSGISAKSARNVGGIAGYIYKGTIEACSSSAYIYGKQYVGGIAGQNYGGTISACYNTGPIATVSDRNNGKAGGIAGLNSSNGVIDQCFNAGSISSIRGSYFGGIAGHNHSYSTVKDCYNTGAITSTSAYQVGGIVGNNESYANIENCYTIGKVDGNADVGAVSGKNNNSTVTNCYYLKGDANGIGYDNAEGKTTALTISQMTGSTALDNMPGFDTEIWVTEKNETSDDGEETDDGIRYGQVCYLPQLEVFDGKVPHSFLNDTVVKMNQDEDGFWRICTPEQLETYRNIVNGTLTGSEGTVYKGDELKNQNGRLIKSFEMGSWLDEEDFDETGKYIGTSPFKQWTPIGTTDSPFIGTFDGNGQYIRYVYIYEPDESAGFFGVSEGIIENFKIFNSHIAGQNGVGAVAGVSSGEIRSCRSAGNIVIGNEIVGGIAGLSTGSIIGSTTSDSSTITGEVIVGGIVGMIMKDSEEAEPIFLSQCANEAKITHTASDDALMYGAGGICGWASDTKIQDCYNTGEISSPNGGKATGGIAGFLFSGTLENALNVGTIKGETEFGALVGEMGGGVTAANSYYLNTSCTGGSVIGTSKTAEELASGSVMYLLNSKDNVETPIWGQAVGADSYPTFYTNGPGYPNARKVTLTAGDGYILTGDMGSWAPYFGNYTFKFAMTEDGYQTGSFAVLVNGKPVTLDSDGIYTIPEVKVDTTITVKGVGKDVSDPTTPTVSATVNGNAYDGSWTADDVILTVSGSTAASGIVKYQYSTDGGKTWSDMKATKSEPATADYPDTVTEAKLTVSEEADGVSYLFRAISGVSRESDFSEAVTVKIDKTEPAITVSGDTKNYKKSDTVTITPTVGISGIAKVEVSKDGGVYKDITASYKDGYKVNANGTYTFRVTNSVGKTETATIIYINIDNVKPVVSIDTGGYTDGTWTQETVVLTISNTAANLGITTFEYKTDDGEWQVYTNPISVSEDTEGTVYTFRAVSAAGITGDEVSIIVKKDAVVPGGDIKIKENSVKQLINSITFGLFFNETVDVEIIGIDENSGIASIEYVRSDRVLKEEEVKALDTWTEYTGKISETAEDAAKFVYYVKITDNAGNITLFGSDGVIFDTTAPTLSGVVDNGIYYTTQFAEIKDTNLQSVTLNGETVTGKITIKGDKEVVYTIVATDKADNKAIFTITMKPIASLSIPIDSLSKENVTSDDKVTVENVKSTVEAIDKTNATDAEKAALTEIFNKCSALIEKIQNVKNEIIQITDGINSYGLETVKSSDKKEIDAIFERIDVLLYGNNVTEAERKSMSALTDTAENLLGKIAEVTAEHERIVNTVQMYNPDMVKSDDKGDIEQLIADAEALLVTENLTEAERKTLEETVAKGKSLLYIINSVSNAIQEAVKDVENITKDNVKFEDKDALKKAKDSLADILEKYNGNLTEYEKKAISDKIAEINVLLEQIAGMNDGSSESDKPESPKTGDNSNLWLWIVIVLISCGMLATMTVNNRRRKNKK